VVVATRDWLPGRHVLVSPSAIASVSWEEKTVRVNATRQQIEASPEYDTRRAPDVAEVALYTQSLKPVARPDEGRNSRL
jgi:hypothetical protein